MFATRAMSLWSIAMLLLPYAVCAATSSASASDTGMVRFSARQQNGEFTIECSPSTRVAALNHAWPDICNQLGRIAIDRAVKQNLIAPAPGLAFGMASRFPPDYSPDPHVVGVTLSRSFPLLANSM